MYWRDDIVENRHCFDCGETHYSDLSHRGCPARLRQHNETQTPEQKFLICDGCNARSLFEHRCHGDRAFVNGEATGKPCQCPDCSEGPPF